MTAYELNHVIAAARAHVREVTGALIAAVGSSAAVQVAACDRLTALLQVRTIPLNSKADHMPPCYVQCTVDECDLVYDQTSPCAHVLRTAPRDGIEFTSSVREIKGGNGSRHAIDG
jgi:hypothetical protein